MSGFNLTFNHPQLDILLAMGLPIPRRLRSKRLCDCSDDSCFEIYKNIDNLSTSNLGLMDLLKCLDPKNYNLIDYSEVGEKGKELIEWCVDFYLVLKELKEEHNNDKIYVSICQFINQFLEISLNEDDGYDHWLMNVMDWYKITSHGSSIRCSWFWDEDKLYENRKVDLKRKKILIDWINEHSKY